MRSFLIAAVIAATAVVSLSGAALAQPYHHHARVCHFYHHHRVCHYR